MEAEIKNYFENNKVKKNKYGGYDFKVEDINFQCELKGLLKK